MISLTKYKDRPAIEVKAENLTALFLSEDGAKLASLCNKNGKELMLTRDGEKYKRLSLDGVYIESECSAFDDMIPTVDPETNLGYDYLDHGDAARIPYSVKTSDSEAVLFAASPKLPLSYEKRIYADDGIRIEYKIENLSDSELSFLYAAHIMLRGEEGLKIETPFSEADKREIVFKTEGYSEEELSRDTLSSFSEGGAAYKFYYTEKIPEGKFSLRYKDGSILEFLYDKEKLPYLGIWFNNGEFQGIHNIAPEPCTAPFDSPRKASEKGYSAILKPRETFKFTIHIRSY